MFQQNSNAHSLLQRRRGKNTLDSKGKCQIRIIRYAITKDKKGRSALKGLKGNIVRTVTIENARVSEILDFLERNLLKEVLRS